MATPRKLAVAGERFGRLVVVAAAEPKADGRSRWLVRCDCDTEVVVDQYNVTSGNTRSCGCMQREASRSIGRRQRDAAQARMDTAATTGERTCSRCRESKPIGEFKPNSKSMPSRLHSWCDECRADRFLREKYGITITDKKRIIEEQGGRCAIRGCNATIDALSALDHCHESGQVRSVLCQKCNSALGLLDENLARMQGLLDYARSWKQLRLVKYGRAS